MIGIPRFLVAALAALLFVGALASPVVAQTACDPTIEVCDPESTIPPYDEPFPDDLPFCDPYLDPTCAPAEFFDDPFFDDAVFCDPYLDPTCAEMLEDDGFVIVVEEPMDGVVMCDPFLDPDCTDEPPASFADYCATVPDPLCDLVEPEPTAPAGLAFTDPPQEAPATVATRSDTSDDLPPTEVPAGDIPVVAANRLLLVVDALAELGAFQRTPNPELTAALRQVRTDVPADGLTDDGYRDEVRRLAADLPVYLDQLESGGVAVSPTLRSLTEQFDEDALQLLDDGETALFDAAPIFSAIADLSARGGVAPDDGRSFEADITEVLGMSVLYAAPAEPVVASTTTVAPSTTTAAPSTTVTPTTEAPVAAAPATGEAPAETSGTPTGLWIGIAAAILLGAAAVFAGLRRTSTGSTVDGTGSNEIVSVDDLLDASRRMTASLDSAEIAAIALGEARRVVDAEGGIVVMRNGDQLETVGAEPDHFFQTELAGDGALRRVVETGRSVAMIATDEPVLVEVPVSMAAVSIVIDGTVAGAILVVRIPSRPFDRQELEALEMLAPLVGSALNAAAAHDSATALVDVEPMTGLKNRRRLDRDMAELTDDDQVAYVMVDVDHFKNFNDVNGHAAGDEALRQVANALSDSVRPGDVVYRYGGEEFCILLLATTTDDAVTVAERARATVEALDIPGGENQPSGRVTISVGVADTSDRSLDDLIERADGALYEAKHGGRNQVRTDG